jgi:lipopolysaccharide export system protein LptA
MKRFILPVLLFAAAGQAAAEKADAYQATTINCSACDADGLTGIINVKGKVLITRGTLSIEAERGRLERSPEGYQRAVLEASMDKKVRFRQKGDGPGEQWMEGEAERVEYDERSGLVKLFSKAKVARTVDGRLSDEAQGEFISYDSHRELFSVRNTNTGEDRPGAGVGTIVLQPKRRRPAAALASTEAR